jgi:hypothetical protein
LPSAPSPPLEEPPEPDMAPGQDPDWQVPPAIVQS